MSTKGMSPAARAAIHATSPPAPVGDDAKALVHAKAQPVTDRTCTACSCQRILELRLKPTIKYDYAGYVCTDCGSSETVLTTEAKWLVTCNGIRFNLRQQMPRAQRELVRNFYTTLKKEGNITNHTILNHYDAIAAKFTQDPSFMLGYDQHGRDNTNDRD